MLILTMPSSLLLPGLCAVLAAASPPDGPAPAGIDPDLSVVADVTRPDVRDMPPIARMRCPPFAVAAKTRICSLSRVS